MPDILYAVLSVVFSLATAGALALGMILFRRWLDHFDSPVTGWASIACFGVAGLSARAVIRFWGMNAGDADLTAAAGEPFGYLVFGSMMMAGTLAFTLRIRRYRVVLLKRPTADQRAQRAALEKRQDEVLANSPLI